MTEPIGYRKEYKMRKVISKRRHITVAIPYEVIERQASLNDLTVDEFIEQFIVIAEYDNFEGVRYTFRKVNGET